MLQALLAEDGRIDVALDVPETPGFAASVELPGWNHAPFAHERFGSVAAALLHDRLGVPESAPLFLELGYDF